MATFTVIEILNKLSATNGKIEKLEILETMKNQKDFKEVVNMALNPFITFGIKEIPEYKRERYGAIPLSKAMAKLNTELVGTQRSRASTKKLTDILTQVDAEEAEVLERIILKDLKVGVSAKTANKIWANLIPDFNVMLAVKSNSKTMKNIVYPAYVQNKFDGMRVNIVIDENGTVQVFSRNGKPLLTHGRFNGVAKHFANSVLDGELLCVGSDGKYFDRKVSNGICNKAVRQTISKEEASSLTMVVWDALPVKNVMTGVATTSLSYKDRLQWLINTFKRVKGNELKIVETTQVADVGEVMKLFGDALVAGEEGIILKNIDSQWEPKRSNHMIKFKAEHTADLEIIDILEGQGKATGKLGSFLVKSKCGLLEVSVGTGFSDLAREDFYSKNYIGDIVEVTYNEVIESKGKKLTSLFLPVFQRMRPDKTEANTLKELT
jgi:ATP-dependent DNA ligase